MSKITFKESELIEFIEEIAKEKKQPVLSESKQRKLDIWVDRFERKNLNSSPEVVFENFSKEAKKLSRIGITTTDISNSLRTNKKQLFEQQLGKNQGFFGTIWDTMREGIYRWILGMFGVKDGELKEALTITLGNVSPFDIPKLLNCDFLTNVLAKGIIIEYLPRKIISMFGGPERGGTMEVLMGNTIANLSDNNQFYIDLKNQIQELVCGKLGEKREQVQGALDDVESENKESGKTVNDGPIPPENSGQKDGMMSGLGDMAKKYYTQFLKNMG